MKFFRKLELKYGTRVIPNLMMYLCIMYAVGWVILMMAPQVYFQYLSLNVPAILHGQIWRLITWVVFPPSTNLIFGLIMIYVYWTIGHNLEMVWGLFEFDWFIFQGILIHIIGAFVINAISGPQISFLDPITSQNFNLSIMLAFMLTFPEATFLLFYIIPIKAKYLGVFYAVMTIINFIQGSAGMRAEIILSLINIILFLVITGKLDNIINNIKNRSNRNRFK